MAVAENSNKGSNVRRLMIASTILTLTTGFSSMVYAQEEAQGASAGVQDFRLGDDQHHLGSPIEGSWIFNIDVPGQGITFNSLISFAAGGVVITSASLPGPSSPSVPGVSSPFYGSWRHAGSNRFQAVFYALVADATGVGVGTRKVSLSLQLTGRNDLVGTAVGSDCDLHGENCVLTAEFHNTGKRILPE